MGNFQQIFIGVLCVGGAFVLGHYLNHQTPPQHLFNNGSPAEASNVPETPEAGESGNKKATLPNFRKESTLGFESEHEAALPPPSQLEFESPKTASDLNPSASPQYDELEIEVPDFSALAARFKGTALELPATDGRHPVEPTGSAIGSGMKQLRASAPSQQSISSSNQNQTTPDRASANAVSLDAVANHDFNPTFRPEDFEPTLRNSSGGNSSSNDPPQPHLTPSAPQSIVQNQPRLPSQPKESSVLEMEPIAKRHPNAIVSYNDPFPSESAPLTKPLIPTTHIDPARDRYETNQPILAPTSDRWAPRDPHRPSSQTGERTSELAMNELEGDGQTFRSILNSPPPLNSAVASGQPREASSISLTPFQSSSHYESVPQTSSGNTQLPPRDESKFTDYVTRAGDTLPAISKHFYGTPDYYLDIYLANRDRLRNPALVPPGIALKIPIYE